MQHCKGSWDSICCGVFFLCLVPCLPVFIYSQQITTTSLQLAWSRRLVNWSSGLGYFCADLVYMSCTDDRILQCYTVAQLCLSATHGDPIYEPRGPSFFAGPNSNGGPDRPVGGFGPSPRWLRAWLISVYRSKSFVNGFNLNTGRLQRLSLSTW
jgi:hypothetical protein